MKLEDQLPAALDNVANIAPVADPGNFDPNSETSMSPTNRSSKRLLASAAALGALGIGGLVIAAGRETAAPVSESVPNPASPTVTLPPAPVAEPGPDGALLLPGATGMDLASVEEGALAGDTNISWYALSTAQPETSTYLQVVAYDAGLNDGDDDECLMDDATISSALTDGTPICLKNRDPADTTGALEIHVDEFAVIIDGNATDDQLVTAAENLRPGASGGFETDPTGLPPGVEFIGAGRLVSDFATIDASQADATNLIQANFDDGSRSIFYLATPSSSPALATYRLGFGTVTDITIRGEQGFVRTLDGQPSYLGLVWDENGTTYQIGSQRLDQNELLAIAEQFEPATQRAWDTAIAAIPDVVEEMGVDEMDDEPMDEVLTTTTTVPIDE